MSKAGGAGSIPDGATIKEWKSQPLSVLLSDIGEAVASLNTAVVGLDAVEKGHKKPESLDIAWSPDDPRAAARKARKFIVEAVLVRVFEAVFEHLNTFLSLSRFSDTVNRWTGKTTRADKIWEIYGAVLEEDYLVVAAVITCHWRNRIIHTRSSAKLTSKQKSLLRDNDIEIAQEFKNLSVDCLLCHFEENRITLKDASVLIAMIIRMARKFNKAIEENLTQQDFDEWMTYSGLQTEIQKVIRETTPDKRQASIRRIFKTRAPLLLDGYEEFYFKAGPEDRAVQG